MNLKELIRMDAKELAQIKEKIKKKVEFSWTFSMLFFLVLAVTPFFYGVGWLIFPLIIFSLFTIVASSFSEEYDQIKQAELMEEEYIEHEKQSINSGTSPHFIQVRMSEANSLGDFINSLVNGDTEAVMKETFDRVAKELFPNESYGEILKSSEPWSYNEEKGILWVEDDTYIVSKRGDTLLHRESHSFNCFIIDMGKSEPVLAILPKQTREKVKN